MTAIEWTDKTWNPVRGCSRVSEGCRHCYAETMAGRIVRMGKGKPTPYDGLVTSKLKVISDDEQRVESRWTGKVVLDAKKLAKPLGWRKPRTVFVNSMSDLFHPSLTNEQIAAVFGVMAATPHTYQVLTKRSKRMREWFAWVGVHGPSGARSACRVAASGLLGRIVEMPDHSAPWPLPNVWLGVSVENQEAADERIPDLLATLAAVRYISGEPLLGAVDLSGVERGNSWSGGNWLRSYRFERRHDDGNAEVIEERKERIDWVIAGCESGAGARPCSVEWLRSLRDQCKAAEVPFFLKQGTFSNTAPGKNLTPGARSHRKLGGIIGLPYLDGVQHTAMPAVTR